MSNFLKIFAFLSSLLSVSAFAEDLSSATDPLPPNTFTTSQHSDEWKIKNALAAGTPVVTEHAAVQDWADETQKKQGKMMGRILRPGNNGWTCMPDIPGRPQHDPMCVDETMMKALTAIAAGKKAHIDKVGTSYMLLGEAREGQNVFPTTKDPTQVKEWTLVGPHVMIVLPDSDTAALKGINQDMSNNMPYTTVLNPNSPLPIWVIPVAKGGERIERTKVVEPPAA